ncbi:hypothetical protein GCM10009530_56600 [Microbispora corallina]|uniref:CobQ/CobB/MinD/ParA nucleotide binding domain-containing protein n=1 Tax=Microbispora corallina TaxID=83302 RepID=A0ABQ4G964_9ACTN|nr:AAA family ATPase [Microbispora corallina]GIH43518.1 hypothetical protein Mco01_65180 [Microbispora corallina]
MARHDREDPHSLEDQLAWLDAIKEMPDEVEIAVSAVTSASLASPPPPPAPAEPEIASPYPKDPWSLVPSEPASGGLFRGAVESVYGSPVAEGDTDTSEGRGRLADAGYGPSRETAFGGGQDSPYGFGSDKGFGRDTAFGQPDSAGGETVYGTPDPFGATTAFHDEPAFGNRDPRRDAFGGEKAFRDEPGFGGREPLGGLESRGGPERGGPERGGPERGGSERGGESDPRGGANASGAGTDDESGREPSDGDAARREPFEGAEATEAAGTAEERAEESRRADEPEEDDYPTSPPGALGKAPFADPSGGERSRGAFGESPGDTDAYNVGAFGDGDARANPYGDADEAASQERSLRGWLEPAVPVESARAEPAYPRESAPAADKPEPFTPAETPFGSAEQSFGPAETPFAETSFAPAETSFGSAESSFGPVEPPFAVAPRSENAFAGSLREDLAADERKPYDQGAGVGAPQAERRPFDTDRGSDHSGGMDRGRDASDRGPVVDRDHGPAVKHDRGPAAERDRGVADEREPYQPRRRQAPPAAAFSAPSRSTSGKPNADSLDPVTLLKGRRNAPAAGWRRIVYKASAGLIKPGEPPEVRRRRELVNRARTPVASGHHRVAVLSLKGGVGKTTTTVGLGATLAQVRGDRVIAVDANPDRGTLSDKVELETSATVRDLLNERGQIKRYVDIRAFTSQAPSRLEILASDRDPSVSEAFSAKDYHAVAQVLENFYSICITDCGTGLLHSAMSGVLGMADQIVLVSSPSVDGARAASATLDWLEAHHYGDLVRAATVVLCSVRPRSKSTVDLDRLEAHFAARCRAVVRVPYDPHLEEGAEIDLDRLQEATRDAYLRLAASVGDAFAGPQALTERRFSEIPDHL